MTDISKGIVSIKEDINVTESRISSNINKISNAGVIELVDRCGILEGTEFKDVYDVVKAKGRMNFEVSVSFENNEIKTQAALKLSVKEMVKEANVELMENESLKIYHLLDSALKVRKEKSIGELFTAHYNSVTEGINSFLKYPHLKNIITEIKYRDVSMIAHFERIENETVKMWVTVNDKKSHSEKIDLNENERIIEINKYLNEMEQECYFYMIYDSLDAGEKVKMGENGEFIVCVSLSENEERTLTVSDELTGDVYAKIVPFSDDIYVLASIEDESMTSVLEQYSNQSLKEIRKQNACKAIFNIVSEHIGIDDAKKYFRNAEINIRLEPEQIPKEEKIVSDNEKEI